MARVKSQTIRVAVPDLHIPFCDDRLVSLMVDFIRDIRPAGVDIIGDVMDCYNISRFDKNPNRKVGLQNEIEQATDFLNEVRKAAGKNCDIRYSEGNHEARLRTLLWGKAKELADLRGLSIPALLELDRFKIRYYEGKTPYRIGPLWYTHGDIARKSNWSMAYGGSAAAAVSKRVTGSVLIGHSHQMGYSSYRGWQSFWEGYEIGCCCHFALDYIVGVPQWEQGWASVTFDRSGAYSVDFIRSLPGPKDKRLITYRGEVLETLPSASVWTLGSGV